MFVVAFEALADKLLGPLVGTYVWFQKSQPCHGCLFFFSFFSFFAEISHCMCACDSVCLGAS